MVKKAEDTKVKLQKGKAYFNIVGKAKVNDYTFTLDKVSESGYTYSRFNLGIETQPGNVIYSELMGGYVKKDPVINAKDKNDLKIQIPVSFSDRFNPKIIELLHDSSFIKVGLESDDEGKTVSKKFLSGYDAIQYVKDNLQDGMIVNVKGNLKYSKYNDKIQAKKEITSIYLSKAEPENFKATFIQTILLDKDSIGKDRVKDEGEFDIYAKVIDYGGKEVKANIPFAVNYSLKVNENPTLTKKLLDGYFKVKKDITELAVEGIFVEGNQVGTVTEDDIPDDMLELIEMGLYSKEEILGKLVIKGEKISKMYITRPFIQKDDKGIIKTFKIEERYSENDLIINVEKEDDTPPFDVDTKADDSDNDWLNDL